MLRRRIRSALYIDFENVPLPADAIANWLAWLEDGVFEPSGRKRRFLQKRVYWNSHAERNRDIFAAHGFTPILVGKFAGLKNGADIRMAMDVIETTYMRSEIDEFILLTGDSDFIPVLERLRIKSKRSAIVATEHRPNIHTTYHLNADVLIPSRRLVEAAHYRRPRRTLLDRLLLRRAQPSVAPSQPAPSASSPGRPARRSPPVPRTAPPEPESTTEIAARRVLKLITQQPRNYVSQKRVLAELERMQGFKRQGPTAFLGTGGYKPLMKELARVEPRITVVEQPGGGTGVVYIPRTPAPEPDGKEPAKPLDTSTEADEIETAVAASPASELPAPLAPPSPAAAATPSPSPAPLRPIAMVPVSSPAPRRDAETETAA